jgi:MoxR-like ATPase
MTDQPDSALGQLIYRGTGVPHRGIELLPPPPPWRVFHGEAPSAQRERIDARLGGTNRAAAYQPNREAVEMVNAALLLRRPLLVSGSPGTGKSGLAFSVAHELELGPVLWWPISRSSTLAEGLYRYDAIGRLEVSNLSAPDGFPMRDIGTFIRLGPLGTALLPSAEPRVLLIDDLDECDIDLPGGLLHVFDQGGFEIPELVRVAVEQPAISVVTSDGGSAAVTGGVITCSAFPMVVITSSGERQFPPQFLRHCLRLHLNPPTQHELAAIVTAHLGQDLADRSKDLIERLVQRGDASPAVDQLLNAIYLASSWTGTTVSGERLVETLLRRAETDDWA